MRMLARSVAVLALVALAACGTSTVMQGEQKTPQWIVFGLKTDYATLLSAAVTYENLPRCETPAAPPCSNQDVVDILRSTHRSAQATLDAAEAVVRTPGIQESSTKLAITSASQAVSLLRSLLLQYKLIRST